jgi:transcriptional regulator with XRE-family HTH domain
MKREELIRSKGYWIAQLQIKLFETVKDYLKQNNLTQSQFADQIGVNKSYVSQILNGDFDHKISKYVDLLIACGKVPILNTINMDDYVNDDNLAGGVKSKKRIDKRPVPKSKTQTTAPNIKKIPTKSKVKNQIG